MAKRKIKGDGEDKKQVKFGLNHGTIKAGKGSKIIESKQIPPWPLSHQGPDALSSWMVTLPPPWTASSNA